MVIVKEDVDNSDLFLKIIFIVSIFIILTPIVYADVFDFIKDGFNSITGKTVQSSTTTVSITIGNNPPVIGNVSIDSNWGITVSGNTSVFFSFIVTDPQGTANINTTSAIANFTNGTNGGMVRWNNTAINPSDGNCVSQGAYGANGINFSCTIRMVFYDTPMNWNVSVFVKDINGNTAQNNTAKFTLGETTSFSLAESAISFGSSTPNTNNVTQTGLIALNNTGNDDIPAGNINVTAVQIHGDSVVTTFIPAENFTIATVSDTNNVQCDVSAAGVYKLVNKSILLSIGLNSTKILTANLPRGPKPNNEEQLFLCLRHVPADLTGQTYSTNTEESWSIIIN